MSRALVWVASGLVGAAIVRLMIRWAARTAPVPAGTICYSWKAKLWPSCVAAFTVAFATYIRLSESPERMRSQPDAIIAMVIVGLSGPLFMSPILIEFFGVHHTYNRTSIRVRSFWSRPRILNWADVRNVRWRQLFRCLDISDGQSVLHILPRLSGLEDFARTCQELLPHEVLAADHEAHCALRLMAMGRASDLSGQLKPCDLIKSERTG